MNTLRIKGGPLGALAVRIIVVILFSVTLDRAEQQKCDVNEQRCTGNLPRTEIEDELRSTAGKHLVMVRYSKNHNHHIEWVHNGAEIDSAKILWARELDEAQNERLFEYFKDRQIWLIRPDEMDAKLRQLRPYPGASAQTVH